MQSAISSMDKSTSKHCLVGIDVGTLSTKGVLMKADGTVLATAAAAHEVCHPAPHWMEHDAEENWWGDSVRVIRGLLEMTDLPPRQIVGLCITGLFPALCPADSRGRPLRNAILYADPRASEMVAKVEDAVGVPLKGDEVIPKFLWLKEHEPEVARETRMLFSVPGYIAYRLTGVHSIDFQTAYRLGGVIDDKRQGWKCDVLSELGVPAGCLAPIQSPLDIVGGVSAMAAGQTGLSQGTPVLAGTTDTFATLVGNGVVAEGEAMIYYGTTGLLTVCSRDLEDVLANPQLVDDETPFVLAAYLLNFGEALEWFAEDLLGAGQRNEKQNVYEAMEEEAARVAPGSDGLIVLPHFAGRVLPQVAPHARGAFFGLGIHHSRYHLWRALLESFGYVLCQSMAALQERGIALNRIVASGGGARSDLWRQIVSDVTELPQEYVPDGSAARGAAFLAAYALGLVDSLQACRDQWLEVKMTTRPCATNSSKYARLFSVYQALDACMDEHYQSLAQAIGQ